MCVLKYSFILLIYEENYEGKATPLAEVGLICLHIESMYVYVLYTHLTYMTYIHTYIHT